MVSAARAAGYTAYSAVLLGDVAGGGYHDTSGYHPLFLCRTCALSRMPERVRRIDALHDRTKLADIVGQLARSMPRRP